MKGKLSRYEVLQNNRADREGGLCCCSRRVARPSQTGGWTLGCQATRFRYEYDFYDLWRHEIRLEQIVPLDPTQRYPRCMGAGRAAPPEDCGGSQVFLALRQRFSIFHITERLLRLVEQPEDAYDPQAELDTLRYWLGVDRFDRRRLNRELHQDALERAAAAAIGTEVLQ